jgi:hypothetical protein
MRTLVVHSTCFFYFTGWDGGLSDPSYIFLYLCFIKGQNTLLRYFFHIEKEQNIDIYNVLLLLYFL